MIALGWKLKSRFLGDEVQLNRTREELVGERTRLVNRFRELLWRYYPQFNELMGKTVSSWHLELWEFAPSPDAAKRIRSSRVEKLLKLNRVRRIDAKGVLEMLRSEKINIKQATAASCVEHITTVVERMKVVDRQLKETKDSIGKVIETMNSLILRIVVAFFEFSSFQKFKFLET